MGSYHSSECGLHDLLNAVGIAHLGLRIVLTFGKESVLNFWKNQSKDVIPGVDGVPYDTSAYPVAFHLTSHTELMAPEELYQYTLVIETSKLCFKISIMANFLFLFADGSFVNSFTGAAHFFLFG